MIRINKHAELNGKFLKDAKALLEKRDYVQTSEKLWGASAQIVKAIALKRGKRLQSHEAINKYIVELKSLKLYLNKFRDRTLSHEEATNIIFSDLKELLKPNFLEVIGDFQPRGNVKTVVRVST